MDFRIADTFTDSLARLTAQAQKAVKTTEFDLQMDASAAGLSFHKLELCGVDNDRGFHIIPWSNDADRLDVRTGLLLSSLRDAAFNTGLLTFDDSCRNIASRQLGSAAFTAPRLEGAGASR